MGSNTGRPALQESFPRPVSLMAEIWILEKSILTILFGPLNALFGDRNSHIWLPHIHNSPATNLRWIHSTIRRWTVDSPPLHCNGVKSASGIDTPLFLKSAPQVTFCAQEFLGTLMRCVKSPHAGTEIRCGFYPHKPTGKICSESATSAKILENLGELLKKKKKILEKCLTYYTNNPPHRGYVWLGAASAERRRLDTTDRLLYHRGLSLWDITYNGRGCFINDG